MGNLVNRLRAVAEFVSYANDDWAEQKALPILRSLIEETEKRMNDASEDDAIVERFWLSGYGEVELNQAEVNLATADGKKIAAIKALRNRTEMSLKEAKDAIEKFIDIVNERRGW